MEISNTLRYALLIEIKKRIHIDLNFIVDSIVIILIQQSNKSSIKSKN